MPNANGYTEPLLNQQQWFRLLRNLNRGVVGARHRRKHTRFPMEGEATVLVLPPEQQESNPKTLQGSLIEASEEGLSFTIGQSPVPEGTHVGIRLNIANHIAYVQGKVTSCTKKINNHRIGVLLEFA